MAETIKMSDGRAKWFWYDIMEDLEKQGGLKVIINPLTVRGAFCGGHVIKTETKFTISWGYNFFLLVSVSQNDQSLINAFANIVGYKPFCQYICKKSRLLTFEWDKKDPNGRFAELQSNGEDDLRFLNN